LVETGMVKFASAIGTVFLNVALTGRSKKHSTITTKIPSATGGLIAKPFLNLMTLPQGIKYE